MVLLVPMSTWMRVLILLSAVPVAFVSNVVRIAATAWCYQAFGADRGAQLAHDAAGWLMMPLALVLVGLEVLVLRMLFVEEDVQTGPSILGKPIVNDRPRETPAGPGHDPDLLAQPPGHPGR
jgi:exosortase/archaeosortase family protein